MILRSKLLLFGDQTGNINASLQELHSLSKCSILLSSYFRLSFEALNIGTSRLPPSEICPISYEDLLGLGDVHSKPEAVNPIKCTVLFCFAQLGLALAHAEQDPLIFDSPERCLPLGICTGMLPAIAFSVASNYIDILRMTPELLQLSLRLSAAVSRRAQNVEPCLGSWAMVVQGLSKAQILEVLDNHHQANKIPIHRRAYVSAFTESSTTISGPPSLLQQLHSDPQAFASYRRSLLLISAPYHTQNIAIPDIDEILGCSPIWDNRISSEVLIASTATGEFMMGCKSVRDLLHEALVDILSLPINMPAIAQHIKEHFESREVGIIKIGPYGTDRYLERSLNRASSEKVESSFVLKTSPSPPINMDTEPIAIIGMSGRFPGAESLEAFWKLLEDGVDTVREIPANRFDINTHCDPNAKVRNTSITPFGCFIERPDLFDARLFKLSPREAAQTDPMQRLMLLTAYEALEMAGYSYDRTSATDHRGIATYYGQSSDDWREVNAGQDIDQFHITGGNRAFGPGRVNYHFGWEGPSMNLDAACSASALAIQLACSALWARDCNMALAGGANVMTASDIFAGLSRANFLSPTGSCKTWDKGANGYCRADGVGTVVLKRLSDAIRDRDNIQATIRAARTNHSANAVSITHPHAETQQKLFEQVIRDAGLVPREIDYVEAHGTGTQAGDLAESISINNVFGKAELRETPLLVGAAKANVGHGEAASGITSVIKALLMMRKSKIPKHIGIKSSINPKLAFNSTGNIRIPTENVPFNATNGKRRILVNNFNAAGGNTSLLLEDYQHTPSGARDPRGSHVIVTSAATPFSLKANMQRLSDYVVSMPESSLADLSYTTTARRNHHAYRFACQVTCKSELLRRFKLEIAKNDSPLRTKKSQARVFVFTGQAGRYRGMGRHLLKTSKTFCTYIQSFDTICQELGFPSFVEIISGSGTSLVPSDLVRNHLALVALEMALAMLWKSWGFCPSIVIGHSLGEYAALCVSGVLSVTDTFYLVGKRATLLQSHLEESAYAMISLSLPADRLRGMLQDKRYSSCEIACLNGPTMTVVSGKRGEIDMLQAGLDTTEDVKVTPLDLPYGFHSAQMDRILPEFERMTPGIQFCKPQIPIASTLLGHIVTEHGVFNGQYLVKQTRMPVNFRSATTQCQEYLGDDSTALWIEMGPNSSCLSMVKASIDVTKNQLLPSLRRGDDDWLTISSSLATAYSGGFDIAWKQYHQEFEDALNLLELPPYAFDLKSYWIQYEGDWSVRKNQKSPVQDVGLPKPALLSTTLHQVEKEDFLRGSTTISFVSDFADEKVRSMVSGHLVNGSALCPSSIYADMALTAASYLWRSSDTPGDPPVMGVDDVEIFKPLIIRPNSTSHLVKLKAHNSRHSNVVNISISSVTGTGEEQHARTNIRYLDKTEVVEAASNTEEHIQQRIDHLVCSANSGRAHRILKGMAYKLFSSLVKYGKRFQGMEEVILDSERMEATARVRLQSLENGEDFYYSPYWIDSLAHISGFVLNGSETTPDDVVYISHGWKNMRVFGELSTERYYQNHVRMAPAEKKGMMVGDVHVLDGNGVVAKFEGVRFQAIKTTILATLLPRAQVSARGHGQEIPAGYTSDRIKPFDVLEPRVPFQDVVALIASELGVSEEELGENVNLEEFGVDSLMSISIMARLQQALPVTLPSLLLSTYPTIGQLRSFFDTHVKGLETTETEVSSTSGIATPGTQLSIDSTQLQIAFSSTTPNINHTETFHAILAEEIEITMPEIQPNLAFSDLGVDSLLSLSIASAFTAKTGMKMDASFLQDYPTLAQVRTYFNGPAGRSNVTARMAPPEPPEGEPERGCEHYHFQGPLKPDAPTLFLLPDGSGSASSYVHLPIISPHLRIIAFNSPLQIQPSAWRFPLEGVAKIYVSEILKLQPQGPYIIGGWSIGGAYSFEVARQLLASGKEVSGLILIDSVVPQSHPSLPLTAVDDLDAAGVFDVVKKGAQKKPVPLDIRRHFEYSIGALKEYFPKPLVRNAFGLPRVHVVWARYGVLETGYHSRNHKEPVNFREEMEGWNDMTRWLLVSRPKLDDCGWSEMVGSEVKISIVDGDHFSMMRPPLATALGTAIQNAIDDFGV